MLRHPSQPGTRVKLCLLSINCNHRHYALGVYVLAAMVRQHLPEVRLRVRNHSVRATPRHLLFDALAEPADVYGLSVHHGAMALARATSGACSPTR
jgi:hypothetical protein